MILVSAVIAAALSSCCRCDTPSSGRKPAFECITVEPEKTDLVGTYVLMDQTIIEGGIGALDGRTCRLELNDDGSFSISNYPDWRKLPSGSHETFNSFIADSGRWELSLIGSEYNYDSKPKDCWGIRFSKTKNTIDPMAFAGTSPPHGLTTILGDPDISKIMRFKKQ